MRPLPFECEDCGKRFNPSIDCCQCDHGRCECGGVLEQVDYRETARCLGRWMAIGGVFWVSVALLVLAVTQ